MAAVTGNRIQPCGFTDTADVCLEMVISPPSFCRVFLLVIKFHVLELRVLQDCILKNNALDSSAPGVTKEKTAPGDLKKTCVTGHYFLLPCLLLKVQHPILFFII